MNRCPLCGKAIKGYPALSRVDSKTEICSDCGVREAFVAPQRLEGFKKLWEDVPPEKQPDFDRLVK